MVVARRDAVNLAGLDVLKLQAGFIFLVAIVGTGVTWSCDLQLRPGILRRLPWGTEVFQGEMGVKFQKLTREQWKIRCWRLRRNRLVCQMLAADGSLPRMVALKKATELMSRTSRR